MGSRMDKYKNENTIPTRSEKNKELYKQIYNAYDGFENLVVPSNAREITMSDLKKEISSREEYRDNNKKSDFTNKIDLRDKKITEEKPEVYDINEILNKAISENNKDDDETPTLSNKDYLKKIKVDGYKTNLEEVKEMYNDSQDDSLDDGLIKTANLSLEILSDLKSDNDVTMVGAPIKNEELPKDSKESDFYSTKYKFSKRDFEADDEEDDDENVENEYEKHNFKPFLKILLLVFGISLIVIILVYLINYFNKV